MFIIFPETHKIIAKELQQSILEDQGIELNEKRVIWGAISPDFLPKYKIYRHYLEDSIHFVVNEIVGLIYFCRFFNPKKMTGFQRKILSTKVGVISHFLSDYVCLPHAERWTFDDHFKVHVAYEKELNQRAQGHDFQNAIVDTASLSIDAFGAVLLKNIVREYIYDVVTEYQKEKSYKRDLNFALDFNRHIINFVFDTAEALYMERTMVKSFVF
ncbi:MAG: zinc dependent phospholipase C family protein [Tissierellia bacterium]|nr:zinc dependent phospholipase C family protein [Tissierellia bacterium]